MATLQERAEDLYAPSAGASSARSPDPHHAVPGSPLDAEIMFIGEAPGLNEDQQGRPFVGAAGNFSPSSLRRGLPEEDVYICNVLKCRPPGNRDPLPGEIDACRDYLDEQIDLIDPLVVVTLGRYSMAKFFPRQSISGFMASRRRSPAPGTCPCSTAAALHQELCASRCSTTSASCGIVARARSSRGALCYNVSRRRRRGRRCSRRSPRQ
jgi:DNA polymerase